MAERLNALVLKTGEPKGFGGSNPSPSAKISEYLNKREPVVRLFCIENRPVGSGFMQPPETVTEHPTQPRGDMLYLET